MGSKRFENSLLAGAASLLAACASFQAPEWSSPVADGSSNGGTRYLSLNSTDDVEYYLGLHQHAYDRMISDAEAGKFLLEFPVVASAVGIPAGLALGEGEKFAIRVATAGAAASAGTTWLQPRQRLTYAVQARSAISCVRREFIQQRTYQSTLQSLVASSIQRAAFDDSATTQGVPLVADAVQTAQIATMTRTAQLALRAVSQGSDDDGRVAIAAADDIVSRLKLRLADVGAAPNFADILATMKAQYDSARARTDAATSNPVIKVLFNGDEGAGEDAVQKVADYPARITECVSKVP